MSRYDHSGLFKVKHGEARRGRKTKEYKAWFRMIQRCNNPKHVSYPNYGARGITVCQLWMDDFEAFFVEVGRAPSSKHTLDRKDNNGNYEPGNCRWATPKEQVSNRRKRKDSKSVD
jgi:hypothetical protein